MKKYVIAISGGVMLGALGVAQADPQYFIEASHVTQPSGGTTLGLINAGVALPLPWRWQDGRLTSRLELAASRSDTRDDGSFQGTAMPLLRYQAAATGLFVEAGIGVAYVSQIHWRARHDLGSHWLFAERLGIGYDFGNFDLSLNLGHMSNGDLNDANDGVDSVGIRFAHTF